MFLTEHNPARNAQTEIHMITPFNRKSPCEISLVGEKGGIRIRAGFVFLFFNINSPILAGQQRAVITSVRENGEGSLLWLFLQGELQGPVQLLAELLGTTAVREPPTRLLWL